MSSKKAGIFVRSLQAFFWLWNFAILVCLAFIASGNPCGVSYFSDGYKVAQKCPDGIYNLEWFLLMLIPLLSLLKGVKILRKCASSSQILRWLVLVEFPLVGVLILRLTFPTELSGAKFVIFGLLIASSLAISFSVLRTKNRNHNHESKQTDVQSNSDPLLANMLKVISTVPLIHLSAFVILLLPLLTIFCLKSIIIFPKIFSIGQSLQTWAGFTVCGFTALAAMYPFYALAEVAKRIKTRKSAGYLFVSLVVYVFLISSLSVQSNRLAFEMLKRPLTSDQDRVALLKKSDTISAGLVNTYVAEHRYAFGVDDNVFFKYLLPSELQVHTTQKLQKGLDALFTSLVGRWWLYDGALDAGYSLDKGEAFTLYQSFFGQDIRKAARLEITKAISSSYNSEVRKEFIKASQTITEFIISAQSMQFSLNFEEFGTLIKDALKDVVDFLRSVPGELVKIWNSLTEWLYRSGQFVWKLVSDFFNKLIYFFQSLPNWCSEKWTQFVNWASSEAQSLGRWISGNYNSLVDFLKKLPRACRDAFSEFVTWWNGYFVFVWNWISESCYSLINFIKSVPEFCYDAFCNFVDWWQDVFTSAWNWIKESYDSVVEFMKGIPDLCHNGFSDFVGWWRDAVKSICDWTKESYDSVVEFVKSIPDLCYNEFSDFVEWWRGTVNAIWDWTKDAWSAISDPTFWQTTWQAFQETTQIWRFLEFITDMYEAICLCGHVFIRAVYLFILGIPDFFTSVIRSVETTSYSSETPSVAGVLSIDAKNLHVDYQALDVTEYGDWAEVQLHERYSLKGKNVHEIQYLFALPESSSITGIWIGDEENRHEYTISPRGAARQIYESKKTTKHNHPALIEQISDGLYKLRIYPSLFLESKISGSETPACNMSGPVCGSFGYTYKNECEMQRAEYASDSAYLWIQRECEGPCPCPITQPSTPTPAKYSLVDQTTNNIYFWLNYTTFSKMEENIEVNSQDESTVQNNEVRVWPVPELVEKRNVFWDGKTERYINNELSKVEPKSDGKWFGLRNVLRISNDAEPILHEVVFNYDYKVITVVAKPVEKPADRLWNVAVVVDRSFKMQEKISEISLNFDSLKKSGHITVDTYLASSQFHGNEMEFVSDEEFHMDSLMFIGGLSTKQLFLQLYSYFTSHEDRSPEDYDAIILMTNTDLDDDQDVKHLHHLRETSQLFVVNFGEYSEQADDLSELISQSRGSFVRRASDVIPRLEDRPRDVAKNDIAAVTPSDVTPSSANVSYFLGVLDGYDWKITISQTKPISESNGVQIHTETSSEESEETHKFKSLAARQILRWLLQEETVPYLKDPNTDVGASLTSEYKFLSIKYSFIIIVEAKDEQNLPEKPEFSYTKKLARATAIVVTVFGEAAVGLVGSIGNVLLMPLQYESMARSDRLVRMYPVKARKASPQNLFMKPTASEAKLDGMELNYVQLDDVQQLEMKSSRASSAQSTTSLLYITRLLDITRPTAIIFADRHSLSISFIDVVVFVALLWWINKRREKHITMQNEGQEMSTRRQFELSADEGVRPSV